MSTASKGAARERKLMLLLGADGWWAARGPASKGIDVVAMKDGERSLFVEVKSNSGSPWMNFRKADRVKLASEAAKAGADAYLVHWPNHKPPAWYPASDWP